MTPSAKQKPFVVPIFIPHAGCPHRCIFCDQTRTTKRTERLPTVDQLDATINRFLSYKKDTRRHTEISFYGGNFLGLPENDILYLLEHASQFIADGQAHGIRFSTRPDTIDAHRIHLLSKFPVTTIELGVQSMNDTVLETSRRGHSIHDVKQAVTLIKQKTYRLGLQMMVGLPGDTPELAVATGKAIAELDPGFVRIYPTVVLEGSPLARWYRQGRYIPLGLNDAVEQVKLLYALFQRRNIPVVRMGLQATEGLNASAGLLAGPFHPAFGELVYAALWRDAMRKGLDALTLRDSHLEIRLNPKLISQVKGQHGGNLNSLAQEFTLTNIQLSPDSALSLDRVLLNGSICLLSK